MGTIKSWQSERQHLVHFPSFHSWQITSWFDFGAVLVASEMLWLPCCSVWLLEEVCLDFLIVC